MTFKCKSCDKTYSSYQSLWNHNKIYHNKENELSIINKCNYCEKQFAFRQGKWKHEQYCEFNKDKNIETKIEKLKLEIKKLETIKQTPTIVPTVKINGNSNNLNNVNNNYTIIINKTGTEDIKQLSYEEAVTIFNNDISSVIKLIELVNFNEDRPENHSFCTPNLNGPYLSNYDTETNKINKERKKYFYDEVVCNSIKNHAILYNKYKYNFSAEKRKQIEETIETLKEMRENSFANKTMSEIKRHLNLLCYNKKDLILNTWSGTNKESNEIIKLNDLSLLEFQNIIKNEIQNSSDEEPIDIFQKK